jgi:MFS family permease
MASPMLQEIFGGRLIGLAGSLDALPGPDKLRAASIGAGFAGLLSLFNIVGRIFWASLSDPIGRKRTYALFFGLGLALYAAAPFAGRLGSPALFVALFCLILTMYGGGFATIPAYLADLFGTQFVGAIHGRLLTAWSTAGILGPVLVNYLRESQIARGVAPGDSYRLTMWILAGLLALGFLANLLVRPVASRHFMSDEELARERAMGSETPGGAAPAPLESVPPSRASWIAAAAAWTGIGLPLAWGIWKTVEKALALCR